MTITPQQDKTQPSVRISEAAHKHHEELFPNHKSTLKVTDPELIEIFDNFTFDEVIALSKFDTKIRVMLTLASIIGSQAVSEYKVMVGAALNVGVTPIEIKEIVYQSVPYVGMAKAFDFIHATNDVLSSRGIQLPLEGQSTTDPDTRYDQGLAVQKAIFGEMKEFIKKPELALNLIDRSLGRGERPGLVVIDAGYGNNRTFLRELEKRKLMYIGGVAKNRKVRRPKESEGKNEIRLDELVKRLPTSGFREINLKGEKPRTVWVATVEVELSKLEGNRRIAIVMNASTPRLRSALKLRLRSVSTCEKASEIDYLITNIDSKIATEEWIVQSYSQRNWVEVFYREAKVWLGLKEYQVRDYRSLMRHFILVFCAYTFILWHTLTGGLRRRWANKPLNTFADALEAFRTAMSSRFMAWLNENRDVFIAYKASLGFIWG
ncbi:transposase [Coleofasciculus sp. LEGE 07081]|nr:transposase [Coleofasciculus sp. LEGE 07081]